MLNWLFPCYVILGQLSCSTTETSQKTGCETYFLIPPNHVDPAVSEFIAKEYRTRKLSQFKRNCHKLVPVDESIETLRLFGKTSKDFIKISSFSDSQLNRIKESSEATKLLFLRHRANNKRLKVFPVVHDFKTRKREKISKAYSLNTKLGRNNPLMRAENQKSYLWALDLLPNSVSMGLSFSSLNFAPSSEAYRITNQESINQFVSPLLSSISLQNIIAPYSTDFWDLNFRWISYASATFLDERISYAEAPIEGVPSPPNLGSAETSLIGASGGLGFEVSVHSLLGTTYLNISLGLALYYADDSIAGENFGGRMQSRIGLGQRAFISDRVYFQIDITGLNYVGSVIKTEYYELEGSNNVSIGFGYFFPETRSIIRNLF